MAIFLVKICPSEELLGAIGKLEHRCTTTNLPLFNDTIIVLKIIRLHSVSLITNFVIPERDIKKTNTRSQYASPLKAMQYRQAASAILTKFCVVDGFPSLPLS